MYSVSSLPRSVPLSPTVDSALHGIWNGHSFVPDTSVDPMQLNTREERAKWANLKGETLGVTTIVYPPFSIQHKDGSWSGIEIGIVNYLVNETDE